MKAYPKKIVLTIEPKDCVGKFGHACNCGVAKAFRRRFPGSTPHEWKRYLDTDAWDIPRSQKVRFRHAYFGERDFNRIRRTGKSQKLTLTRV